MTRRGPTSPEALLSAARTEFSRHGLAGGRTDRIARAAGVNKQLIHYYFRTKDALYREIIDRAAREVAEALGRIPLVGLTAVERLRRLVKSQFDFLAENRELTRLLINAEGAASWFDEANRPVAELLTEGQATGFFRDDIDPVHHARQALLFQLGYFALESVTRTWDEPAAWRDRAAELVVKGCTW